MKKMFNTFLLIFSLLILSLSVFAMEDLTEAKQLIDSKIACDQLSDEQLETIGDYYMEQMHPEEAHERMDEMMGGEGSESLKLVHINMAKSIYCGEKVNGMMNGGMMSNNMMGSGIMGNDNEGGMNMMGYGSGYGMMGSSYFGWTLWSLVYIAIAAFIFGIVFWWTHNLMHNKKKK